MAELLHDLLFLARSDDDTARQYHQSVDLDELVLHEAHRLRALGATITLMVRTRCGCPVWPTNSPGCCATSGTTP